MKRKHFALLLLFAATMAFAQEEQTADEQSQPKNEFNLDLNMLGHGELRYGGFTEDAAENKAQFLMERTRLTIGYKRPYIEAKVTAQHSGIWGEKSKGSFNLYEAWAQLSTKFGLFARMGRQVLSYDDERIIGANDWAMASLSHDVLKLGYEGYGHKVHAILGFNQNAENITGGTYYAGGSQPYKIMHTLWYHYDVPKIHLLQAEQVHGRGFVLPSVGSQRGQCQD